MIRMRSAGCTAVGSVLAAILVLAGCGGGGGEQPTPSERAAAGSSESTREQAQADAANLDVYRFAKISTGAYFYTADEAEKNIILRSNTDMRYEGVGFFRSEGEGTAPVYRFANLVTGGYFYTASAEERDVVINTRPDMRFEGSSFAAAAPGDAFTQPVYRLANLNNGAYLYTTSAIERSAAVGLGFWRDEKTAFRAKDTGGPQPFLAAGRYHTCAVSTDTKVHCWGYNNDGQIKPLASPADDKVLRAIPIEGVSGAVSVALGDSFSCAHLRGGNMTCWGRNTGGQLGSGQPGSNAIFAPVPVVGTNNATAMAAGAGHGCALTDQGLVRCWGQNDHGQLGADGGNGPVTVQEIAGVSAIGLAAGSRHSCALLVRGSVQCWGSNSFGQRGATFPASAPLREVIGIDQAMAVSTREFHNCALLRNGSVQCWGWNFYSQLGFNGANSDQPRTIEGISDAVAIAAGGTFGCALRSGGQVLCWGSNEGGEMGNGQPPSETRFLRAAPVTGITNARAITAGYMHACALLADGTVKCWGYNAQGALGDGSTQTSSLPVTVVDPSGQLPLKLF